MKKQKIFLLCLLATVFVFDGCTTRDSEIYGQGKVLEYVDSVCPEPYHLTGKTLIEESPDNMEYYFETDNRKLSFKANSYLSPVWIDATQTGFYSREISCDYVSVVHDLYREDVKAVLETAPNYMEDHGWIYLLSFSDIGQTVDTILAADQIYGQELAYNPPEFLSDHPVTSVHLVWQRSEEEAREHETWVNMTDVGITGQHDREELYDRLANIYAQLCVDGKIENAEGVPWSYLADKHVALLPVILLNGKEMLYDDNDNPYGPYGLTTDDYKYCWYSEDKDSYMMVIDTGLISENMSMPLIIREYVKALGGDYSVSADGDRYTSTWTIGADRWVMRSDHSDEGIRSLEISKNGRPLDISYITVDDDFNVSATFCVGVTVEDFCRLFDLTWEIEESQGKILFTY